MDLRRELIPGVLYYTSWRLFLLVSAVPSIIAGLAFTFFPESPKFLMSKGRTNEAIASFQRIYSINSRKPPETFPVCEKDISDILYTVQPKVSIRVDRATDLGVCDRQSATELSSRNFAAGFFYWLSSVPCSVAPSARTERDLNYNLISAIIYSLIEQIYDLEVPAKNPKEGSAGGLCKAVCNGLRQVRPLFKPPHLMTAIIVFSISACTMIS